MRITRLRVENFRNLENVDIPLSDGAVVVGENSSGKSNLLHALRLVLDATLSTQQRTLLAEDFSESCGSDPMGDGCSIRVSVELDDFDRDPGLLAALHSALIEGEPVKARLTYIFRQRDPSTATMPAYEWLISGGDDDDRRIGGELRSYLHHVHMHALRDVEGDLASWRRSPLRPLLDAVSREASGTDLAIVKDALDAANAAVKGLPGVTSAATAIEQQSQALVGTLHSLAPTLDIAPADPARTLRSLRLFLDGAAQRALSSGSLGALNVLYIALVQLELARRLKNNEIEHALISIEEPEAHLHPHLQRRMFAGVLANEDKRRSTIVTTHSPHIVSVTNPQRLVVLRAVGSATAAFAAVNADLSTSEWDDLGRYLDATRSELVFARRVLLVEGFAEQVLIPRLSSGLDLDENGVSVCAIHGTHFLSYVKFLRAIGTPYAVLTDGDPDAGKGKTGEDRVQALVGQLGVTSAAEARVFVGNRTFESDIFDEHDENAKSMLRARLALPTTGPKNATLEHALNHGGLSGEEFLGHVSGLKGRFAQRLSADVDALKPPRYIAAAFEALMA